MSALSAFPHCCRRRLRLPPNAPGWSSWSSRNSRPAGRRSARAGSCAIRPFTARFASGSPPGSPAAPAGRWSALSRARSWGPRAIANSCSTRCARRAEKNGELRAQAAGTGRTGAGRSRRRAARRAGRRHRPSCGRAGVRAVHRPRRSGAGAPWRAPRRGAGVIALLSPGPGRARPACRHFGRCGGCALQHLDPDFYRRAKLAALTRALARLGIGPQAIAPLQQVPPGRRRARLGLARPRAPQRPVRIGFRERFRHDLVDLHECPVLEGELFALVEPLRRYAGTLLPPGGSAEVMLTRTDSGVDLVFEAAAPPGLEALEALARFAEERDLARIVWRSPDAEIPVVARRPVRVIVSGVAVRVPPGAFLQASAAAEAMLIAEVVRGLGPARPALDLFAGLGGFTLALRHAGPVHAVEGDADAAAALAAAARGLPGVTVECRDLARNPLRPDELAHYAAAVFNPPRAGALAQAQALAASRLD